MPRKLNEKELLKYQDSDRCPECQSKDYAYTDVEKYPGGRRISLYECTDCGGRWIEEYSITTVAIVKDGRVPIDEDTQTLNLAEVYAAMEDAEDDEADDKKTLRKIAEFVDGMEAIGYTNRDITRASSETMFFIIKYQIPPKAISIRTDGRFTLFPDELPDGHVLQHIEQDKEEEPQHPKQVYTPSELENIRSASDVPFPIRDDWGMFPAWDFPGV